MAKTAPKSLVFGVAPTYIADIEEYPPGNVSICRKFPKGFEILLRVEC